MNLIAKVPKPAVGMVYRYVKSGYRLVVTGLAVDQHIGPCAELTFFDGQKSHAMYVPIAELMYGVNYRLVEVPA